MIPFINLLPWRQQRRLQQLRHGALIAGGCLVSGVLMGIALPNIMAWRLDLQHLHHEYLLQMDSALQRKYQEVQELKNLQQRQEKVNAQRQAFSIWERRLTVLASQLPESVWFISLSLKNEQMFIRGHARQATDIQWLENSLQMLDGKPAVKAGAISQDSKGLLMFTFTVKFSEAIHVVPA